MQRERCVFQTVQRELKIVKLYLMSTILNIVGTAGSVWLPTKYNQGKPFFNDAELVEQAVKRIKHMGVRLDRYNLNPNYWHGCIQAIYTVPGAKSD